MQKLDSLPWMKPEPMKQYPHMLAMDAAVWTQYLREIGPVIRRVAYDVHVGTPMPLPDTATDMERAIAAGISRKRIDAVTETDSGLYVIEVKPLGNHQAMGQVMLYLDLFKREFAGTERATGMIVCAEHDPDLIRLAATQGIQVFDVEVTDY